MSHRTSSSSVFARTAINSAREICPSPSMSYFVKRDLRNFFDGSKLQNSSFFNAEFIVSFWIHNSWKLFMQSSKIAWKLHEKFMNWVRCTGVHAAMTRLRVPAIIREIYQAPACMYRAGRERSINRRHVYTEQAASARTDSVSLIYYKISHFSIGNQHSSEVNQDSSK